MILYFFNDNIVLFNEGSDNATFFSDDMGPINVDLNNVIHDDDSFNDDDPETIIHVSFSAW